jgi:hypothetical protein
MIEVAEIRCIDRCTR